MTQTEYLEQICANLGVDISTLPDRLLSTYLSAISEKLGMMKENGTLADFLEDFASGGSGGTGGGDADGVSAFMDLYLENGNKTDFEHAFRGVGWTDETFKPNHNMTPLKGNYMFYGCKITNLTQNLKDCGVSLNFDNASTANYAINASSITHFPSVPLKLLNAGMLRNGKALKELSGIDGLTYRMRVEAEDGEVYYTGGSSLDSNAFQSLESLEEILNYRANEPSVDSDIKMPCGILMGTVNLSWSPNLSRNTLLMVKDMLGYPDAQGSLIIGETNIAKLTDEEITEINDKGWDVS